MGIVDGWSAGGMSAETAQSLGFPACIFALGAPEHESDIFANALRDAVRGIENEGAKGAERLDLKKTVDPGILNAALSSFMPPLLEGEACPEVLNCQSEAVQEILAGAVDVNPRPPPVSTNELMETLAVQYSGGKEEPPGATGVQNAVPTARDAPVLQEILSRPMPGSLGFAEPTELQHQSGAAPVVSARQFDGFTNGSLLGEFAQSDDVHIAGSPPGSAPAELSVAHEEVVWLGFPRISVTDTASEREVPGLARTVAFPKAHVWTLAHDEFSLARAGPEAPAEGKAPSANAEIALALQGSISRAGIFDAQDIPDKVSNLAAAAFLKSPFDANVQSIVSEHPVHIDVTDVPEIGRGQLFDQLVQGVRVAQSNEGTEMLVHLKPHFLGRLSIRALADDHGMLVEIRAENEVVRQVMQDNLADMRQWLADRDVPFHQLNILADTGWHSQREPDWSPENVPVRRESEPESAPATPVETIPHLKSGVIDYFA